MFDWLIRVLPGRVVTFGLDLTVGALDGLGFNIKDTAKTAEQVLAVVLLFVTGVIVGLLFFSSCGPRKISGSSDTAWWWAAWWASSPW